MRSSVFRSIKRFAQNDPFGRYRDDDALAQLVRETVARTPAPWSSLLAEVAGLAGLSEDSARALWTEGVQHRRRLIALLGRPVLLRVALLDLLSADPRVSGTPGPVPVPRPLLAQAAEGLTTDELTRLRTREHLVVLHVRAPLTERVDVHLGVLPHVQRRQPQAEGAGAANGVHQPAVGDGARAHL